MENNGKSRRTRMGAVQGYGEKAYQTVRGRAGSFKHFFRKLRDKKKTGPNPKDFQLG